MPLTTELPIGDLFEFIGDFRLNGDGPPTTGRMGLDRLQAILLSSTSLVGAHIADIENRLTTAEGFTNQIASILTRLQTVEALGGISPGTDLAADGLAVRTTRYWGRPGEAIRAWTASIAAPPAAAVPLTEGGAYSIVPTALGPALRIAGAAAARPIAQVPLIEDQIEEFRVTVKRSADDATPANNAPVFVFGCFNADGTDNGTAPLPAEPLTVDQGFKTLIFRASRAAGFGTVDLPAGTRRVNLIPGGKGSGSIDVVKCRARPAVAHLRAPDHNPRRHRLRRDSQRRPEVDQPDHLCRLQGSHDGEVHSARCGRDCRNGAGRADPGRSEPQQRPDHQHLCDERPSHRLRIAAGGRCEAHHASAAQRRVRAAVLPNRRHLRHGEDRLGLRLRELHQPLRHGRGRRYDCRGLSR